MFRKKAAVGLAAGVLALAAALTAPSTAQADDTPATTASPAPAFADGFGLTQVADDPALENPSIPADTPTDFRLTVTTPEVANEPGTVGHHIRVTLPADYYANPGKRYPVLYLLNGSPGDPCNYFNVGNVPKFDALRNASDMIIVMPSGGARGWYSNWRDQNTAAGAQNWENFHINQVVPFIDANLRTLADKQHRAIAGISMGGYGAVRLAGRHPELYSHAATLSGDVDLSRDQMVLREAIMASLSNPGNVATWNRCGAAESTSPYSPAVPTESVYGSTSPLNNADALWNANDPTQNAARLTGVDVSIYVGNGNGLLGDPMEWWLESASVNFDAALRNTGQHPYFVRYGNGTGWDCNGGHNFGCWDTSLADLLPRLQRKFAGTGGVGAVTGDQGKCMDVVEGRVVDSTPVQTYACNSSSAQTWTTGHGNTLRAYGKCLDVANSGTANGTRVQLFPCNGSGAQDWFPYTGNRLRNPQSGRCLAVPAWSLFGSTQLELRDCTGARQAWALPTGV